MKAAEMRKANKSEVVTVSAGLWMILHTSSTAKKVSIYGLLCEVLLILLLQLLPLNTSTTFQVGYNADDMLNDLASKAKGSYDMSPTTIRNINTRFCPSFERSARLCHIVFAPLLNSPPQKINLIWYFENYI